MKNQVYREKIVPLWLSKIVQGFAAIFGSIMFYFFGHMKIEGMEYLKEIKGPVIFAGGHRHELDVAAVGTALSRTRFFPVHYVSMSKNRYKHYGLRAKLFYGGTLFKLLGAYPVYKGAETLGEALANHNEILRRGRSVVIYPEGRVSRDGAFGRARPGVAYLAAEHNLPIIPFTINGLWGTTSRQWFGRKKHFTFVFGKPILPENLFAGCEDAKQLTRQEFEHYSEVILNKIIDLNTDVQELRHAEDLVHA